jgi:hypothetical protein
MRLLPLLLLVSLLLIPAVMAADKPLVLAKGDSLDIPFDDAPWTIWLFSRFGPDHLYDISNTRILNGTYYFHISGDLSESLDPGEYTMIKQYPGYNDIKEISYAQRYNASLQLNEYLTSPFKGVEDIDINGWQPSMVRDKLIELSRDTDDRLDISTLIIEEPLTVVNNIAPDYDRIYLSGISNLQIDTELKILWDSERLVSERDYFFNTFYTKVREDINGRKYWETKINVSVQDLPVGKHWVEVIANGKTTTVAYTVGEFFKNQTPPPMQTIKYLNNGVIVTPTPEIIKVPVPYEVTVIKTVVITTQPFPKNPLGEEYNPSVVPDVSNTAVPLMMMMVAMVVLRGKIWK